MESTDAPDQKTDTRAKSFGSQRSVELDAIDPGRLRNLVRRTIEQHMPKRQFKALLKVEESERMMLHGLVGMARREMKRTRTD